MFRSQAQWHHLFAREARGEVPPGTALEMARASPPYHALPVYAGDDNLGVVPGKPPLVRNVIRSGTVQPAAAPVYYPTPPAASSFRSSARPARPAPRWRPLAIGGMLVGALALAFARVTR